MRSMRAWVVAVVAALFIIPLSVRAQELKTINKPGAMLANVATEDENKKPLKIKKGEKVTVIYSRDDWMWVKTKGGRGGWVLKKEVKVDEGGAPPAEKVVAAPVEKAAPAEKTEKAEANADAKKSKAEEKKRKDEEKKAAAEEKKAKDAEKKAAAAEEKKRKDEEKRAAADEKKAKDAEKKAAAAEEKKRKDEEKHAANTPPAAALITPAPEPAPVMPAPEVAQPAPQPAPQPEPQQLAMVQPAPQPQMQAAPAMAAGFITILASEPGASVSVDGRKIGDVPVHKLQVEGGKHQVMIMKDDFKPTWQDVEVNGNEVNVSLALPPNEEAIAKHRMGVYSKWGIGFGILGAGILGAVVFGVVGIGGALLWAASASANTIQRVQDKGVTVTQNDPISEALTQPLSSPVFTILGAALTLTGPVLALIIGVGASLGAAALFMTAGDPGRYSAYQE